jgi:lysophospholipase L1-like esterase
MSAEDLPATVATLLRKPGPLSRALRDIVVQAAILLVTFAAIELMLRMVDLRFLREGHHPGYSVIHSYDPTLGWLPTANSAATFVGSRTIQVSHNSLGLRDIEHDRTPKPTIMFVGDSFVWGYDVEADDRFTELLRPRLPAFRVVNAGIMGYGTDQEYLLLQRLWSKVDPDVVVLMFCVTNDRADNSSNARYDGYFKPYLAQTPDGEWQFQGLPVPKSRHAYFQNDWLAHNSWVARVAVSLDVLLRHPAITVPDPTEHLVGMMHDLVAAHGAKFLVGLQGHEPQLEAYLEAQSIPYITFEGADAYAGDGDHWTPKGHALVADRLMSLLAQTGVTSTSTAAAAPTQ